jgi:hypothetical protein
MHYGFKLSRKAARLRAPLAAIAMAALFACDGDNGLTPDTSAPVAGVDEGNSTDPTSTIADDTSAVELVSTEETGVSSAFAGGIPIGTSAQPNTMFGNTYNGALRNIHPQYLARDLGTIKARGGKVVLMMAGPQWLYQDAAGHFSLTKWKARIDRYDNVNVDAYVKDGTLIGHYLIDEPNDPANWNGQTISGTTLDEMARYSKQKWPGLPTIVRTYPSYLEKWGPYRYLDAAWAQYVQRKGEINDFVASNVGSAKRQGLGLVVGLNLLKGGPNKTKMTASQVKSWGTTLLNNSYPCAFISWQYNDNYLSSSSIRDAMNDLRNAAERHVAKSCSG